MTPNERAKAIGDKYGLSDEIVAEIAAQITAALREVGWFGGWQ